MCVVWREGFVIIDVADCNSRQLSDSYQDFGLLCARRKVRLALLRTGCEDAYAHYALRDVLRTVVRIAGIRVRFRLAVVAGSDAIAQVCENMLEELRALGCEVRLFGSECQAEQWLLARKRPAQPVLGQVAAA
jgi:hypothetical protein